MKLHDAAIEMVRGDCAGGGVVLPDRLGRLSCSWLGAQRPYMAKRCHKPGHVVYH